ncbi:MAG: hypothetical protein LBV12_00485, partial [Puniceicoccales bacterium]|nr:hypothetical protein [Puniceicoccales bacterium]
MMRPYRLQGLNVGYMMKPNHLISCLLGLMNMRNQMTSRLLGFMIETRQMILPNDDLHDRVMSFAGTHHEDHNGDS